MSLNATGRVLDQAELKTELRGCAADIERAFATLRDCFAEGGKVLLCGNGGSAADCEHWSGELMKSFRIRRSLDEESRRRLPTPLANGLEGGLPAIPLPSLTSLSTAFANDANPHLVFAQGVWVLGRGQDVLIAISTSGNSANICHALHAARAKGLRTIGLTGAGGGDVAKLAEICIRVPAVRVDHVQELHLPVYHLLSELLEREFFGGGGS